MKPSKIHRLAKEEIRQLLLFYKGADDLDLVDDLRIRLRTALLQIKAHPARFSRWKGTRARKYVLRRFPYVMFYIDYPDYVRILAVAHTSRRPGYWRKRIAVD